MFDTRWSDPRHPLGKSGFFVAFLVTVTAAQALLRWLEHGGTPIAGFSACVVVVFGVMGVVVAKRLTAVRWSRWWALGATGPALLYVTGALGGLHSRIGPGLSLVLGSITLAFCVLMLALFWKSERKE